MPKSIKSFLLFCTLTREEYDLIQPLVWERNKKTLRVTSILGAFMGLAFLFLNAVTRSVNLLPYFFLFCGSMLVYFLLKLCEKRNTPRWFGKSLCYVEMLMICMYAGILSIQKSNYAMPGTSIVAFIALLPLSIDDRPVIMYAFMMMESVAYLTLSYFMKSAEAYALDIMNVSAFCIIGMILYGVICVRNVREIYQSARVEKIQQGMISSLATVVEERDENTGNHIQRTADYVRALTDAMKAHPKYAHLGDAFYKNVMLAAPMHDMGKIRIPDAILNKPGKLTEEEFAIMKKHSAYGADIIQKTMQGIEDEDYYKVACNIARYHHERYDGNGYPDGLKGAAIPLEARIMALADVYDALVSERVYKKAFPSDQALRIIQDGAGTQFDPDLTVLFLNAIADSKPKR